MKIANLKELSEGINEKIADNHRFFIYKNKDSIKVYDSICPHQGGSLCYDGKNDNIYCKVHHWKFDIESGKSNNVGSAKLLSHRNYIDSNGDINIESASTPPLFSSKKSHSLKDIDLTISLHSHATLEFKYRNFKLICDPWIDGYAFFGAWRHYPKPIIKASELKPNAIWISHEHSDHFHPQTLAHFDKNTPIYLPAFLNKRLESRLAELGFKNVITLPFGEKTKIYDNFYITIYEPASLWNDSQLLLEIESFRMLNINDSGINHRIHKEVGDIDCIGALFSPGASGYPATYTHISDEDKIAIYERSKVATLDMLFEACKLYNAKYFLPFATHFILNHPNHLKYMKLVRKNIHDDAIKRFEGSGIKVLDILAGESYKVGKDRFHKIERNPKIFDRDVIFKHIESDFDENEFSKYYPDKKQYAFDKNIVYEYFKNLNNIPEMIFCEDLTMSIFPDSKKELGFSFEIKNGVLQILEKIIENPSITMNLPSEILMYICKHNESWDEATIGYWCECSRYPDIYHAEFWRILQTPFYIKRQTFGTNHTKIINKDSNLADVLEKLGEVAEKILARYGLYCLSCDKAPKESLEQACLMHGIDENKMQRMIKELCVHTESI